jgi:hypothetical protein
LSFTGNRNTVAFSFPCIQGNQFSGQEHIFYVLIDNNKEKETEKDNERKKET